MELDKKKYAKDEVNKIISEISSGFENKLSEQKARISELLRENIAYKSELDAYYAKDTEISAAIKRAESYSASVKSKTDIQYALAIESLTAFFIKWNDYFDHLKEKYPMYPVVSQAVKIKDEISKIIGKRSAETVIYTANAKIDEINGGKTVPPFDPKKKIADYIAATEDNGFNMDEVLNPGSLKLEDLCRELGLLTENE